jgi:hypothetical protein
MGVSNKTRAAKKNSLLNTVEFANFARESGIHKRLLLRVIVIHFHRDQLAGHLQANDRQDHPP